MPLVVIGAGMAGIAAAFQLVVKHGRRDVVLVDGREPMTLTSDKGTQGYRNWWPGPDDVMLRFVSRSIDLLDDVVTLFAGSQADFTYRYIGENDHIQVASWPAVFPVLDQLNVEVDKFVAASAASGLPLGH